jgi:hypothetical protein
MFVSENTEATNEGFSFFDGVDPKIDELLQIPHDRKKYGGPLLYKSKESALFLRKSPSSGIGPGLVSEILKLLEANWSRRDSSLTPSSKLWVPRIRPEFDEKFQPGEVPLERTLVDFFSFWRPLLGGGPDPELMWFNQIPAAQGLTSKHEGKIAVDLVCRTGAGKYDFVELKFPKTHPGETPLGAAMQLLKYGAAYLFAVRNLEALKNANYKPQLDDQLLKATATELLEAAEVKLCVLAPSHFYKGFDLGWLETELNVGLQSIVADSRNKGKLRTIAFQFEYLHDTPFRVADRNGFMFDFSRYHLTDWNAADPSAVKRA